MSLTKRAAVAICLVFSLFLGACGDDDDDDDGAAGSSADSDSSRMDAGEAGSGAHTDGDESGTGGETDDDAGTEARLLAFGEQCREHDECEGGVCHQFGQEPNPLCTQSCDSDDACPEGSDGKKCNKRDVCRP